MNFQLSFPIRLMRTAHCPTMCDSTAQNVKNYKLAKLTRVLLSNIFIGAGHLSSADCLYGITG